MVNVNQTKKVAITGTPERYVLNGIRPTLNVKTTSLWQPSEKRPRGKQWIFPFDFPFSVSGTLTFLSDIDLLMYYFTRLVRLSHISYLLVLTDCYKNKISAPRDGANIHLSVFSLSFVYSSYMLKSTISLLIHEIN